MSERFRYFLTANAMLAANLCAIVVSAMITLIFYDQSIPHEAIIFELGDKLFPVDVVYLVLILILTLWYERPIRNVLRLIYRKEFIEEESIFKAQRRMLNEPYFLIVADFVLWILSGLFITILLLNTGMDPSLVYAECVITLLTALITITTAFFLLRMVLQRKLTPVFFPRGGLSKVKGVWRIRIRGRLLALALAINLVPFAAIISLHTASSNLPATGMDHAAILISLNVKVILLSLAFMALALVLTLIVAGNLSRPLWEIIGALRRIRRGVFDDKVRVVSNDEIGYTGEAINQMTEGLKERDFIKEAFGKYVTREVRDEVLSGRVPLDGEMKDVTILFSDLRGFTEMTEALDPKLVVSIMNSYFKEMAEAIQEQGGLIFQYIGDEIYAVFGAPVSRPDHPSRAFKAGMEMRRRMVSLNERLGEKGWPALRHGIGVHSGQALAANIGSPDRLSYLLVGDTVNLASRLQSLTKEVGTDMILSAATHAFLNDTELSDYNLKRLPPTQVKGKRRPVDIFAVA